ncbi:DMT family transporter [Plantibacter flavus]|uniref:DMT family transporter n=1 Tax=Plantibacter flavus TaxID=150123 RepID=UPI003F146576
MVKRRFFVFLVLANLFWAGNFVFGRLVVGQISPLDLTFLRWVFAAPIIVLLAIVVERPDWRAALREWPKHLVLGLLGLVAFCLFSYEALRHTSSLDASLVGATNPALIAVTATVLARQRMRGGAVAGILLSLLGVLLVLTRGDLGRLLHLDLNVGALFMLGAVAVWTAYTILGRTLRTPPITSSAVQAVMTSVLLLPVALWAGLDVPVDAGAWAGLGYIVVFPSVLSLVLWNLSVKQVGASRSGIFLNLMPVFVALIGLLLGTPVTLVQIAGGVLVIAGVWLTNRPARGAVRLDPEAGGPRVRPTDPRGQVR